MEKANYQNSPRKTKQKGTKHFNKNEKEYLKKLLALKLLNAQRLRNDDLEEIKKSFDVQFKVMFHWRRLRIFETIKRKK